MKNLTILFGKGLFETWRVYPGPKIPFVREHLKRMKRGTVFFGWPFEQKMALKTLEGAIKKLPPHSDFRLRLTLKYDEINGKKKASFLVHSQPLNPELKRLQREGVKITLAPFKKHSSSPLRYFKTTCFLENIFALKKARKLGYYEALFLNERDEICEGCISNIFFVKDEQTVVTPPLKSGVLPGITRNKIIGILSQMGMKVQQIPIYPKDLRSFQAVFLTNAVIEILPIKQIKDIHYPLWNKSESLLNQYRNLCLNEPCFLPSYLL